MKETEAKVVENNNQEVENNEERQTNLEITAKDWCEIITAGGLIIVGIGTVIKWATKPLRKKKEEKPEVKKEGKIKKFFGKFRRHKNDVIDGEYEEVSEDDTNEDLEFEEE